MRVLLVDPSETIRRRLRELMSELCPLEVLEAGQATHALELAGAGQVDIVLLDIAIGNPTAGHHEGMALLSELRRLAPSAMLVVLTNHSSEAYRQACMVHGADLFFDKSLEFESAALMTRKLAAARGGRQAPGPA